MAMTHPASGTAPTKRLCTCYVCGLLYDDKVGLKDFTVGLGDDTVGLSDDKVGRSNEMFLRFMRIFAPRATSQGQEVLGFLFARFIGFL